MFKKVQVLLGAAVFTASSLAVAALSPPTSAGTRGFVNNYDRVDFVNQTFTDSLGNTEPLLSMHVVIKDLDGPSEDIVKTCNIPLGVEVNEQNKLDYSLKYEHAFRAFVYANTDLELESNLVAVFMVSPGRFGVHVERSGKRTLGGFTDAGEWDVLDHDPSILAGEKIGQFDRSISVFDLYKSKASEGAPMFEAIFFKRGTALHGSNGYVDGNPRSHACVRFRRDEAPLNLKLAKAVKGNVKVTVRDTEVFKSCYNKELIRKARDSQNYALEAWEEYESKTPEQKRFDSLSSGGLY